MVEQNKFIPVAEPAMVGNEREYVLDCLDSNWISSAGDYVNRFENAFAAFAGTRHAMSCSNGTTALHLALAALKIGPGDEVIVPSMTFVATANAVAYCGARPVFADSLPGSWNIAPSHVQRLISPDTRAIIAVHLFGLPCDMDALQEIANESGIPIIEDAAEAHGARYQGRTAGSLATMATFSFYGNKILTTGEGGMVTTDDDELAARVRLLKGQGVDPERRYWHSELGYNYRLTNIACAIGLAQLEKIDWQLERRRSTAEHYRQRLSGDPRISFQSVGKESESACWMSSVVLQLAGPDQRDHLIEELLRSGIETRPFFVPMHLLPMYADQGHEPLPVAEHLGNLGISLPSGAHLSEQDLDRVSSELTRLLDQLS